MNNLGGSKSYKIEYIKESLHRNGYIQELKVLSKFHCASKVAWLGIDRLEQAYFNSYNITIYICNAMDYRRLSFKVSWALMDVVIGSLDQVQRHCT